MENNKAPHGTFTKIPNVLLDTCDLADEAIMLFSRLLRQVGHKGGVFHGSIRKLASAVQVKRDKAHRNLNALKGAKLVSTGTDADLDISTIELHTDDLWELNIAYNNGIEVPRWTDLQEVLKLVREIRQQRENEQSQKSDEMSEKSDTDNANIGQSVREIGQGVRPSEHKVPTKNEKNINTNKTMEESTNTRSSFFTSEELKMDTLYCYHYEDPPKLTKKLKSDYDKIAPYVKNREDMDSLIAYTEDHITGNDPRAYPGNLARWVDSWRLKQEQDHTPLPWSQSNGPAADIAEEPTIETYAGQPLEYWTEERIRDAQLTKIQRRTILRLQQEQMLTTAS